MEHLGTLETVCRYPVKSMAGEEIKEAFVGYSGMMGDRVYAFVRPDGPKGFPWHTGREQKDLLLFHPHFTRPKLLHCHSMWKNPSRWRPALIPCFRGMV